MDKITMITVSPVSDFPMLNLNILTCEAKDSLAVMQDQVQGLIEPLDELFYSLPKGVTVYGNEEGLFMPFTTLMAIRKDGELNLPWHEPFLMPCNVSYTAF